EHKPHGADDAGDVAIMGPTAVATPHSTTTRVKPMKMRIARISVAAAAHKAATRTATASRP
ncbi:MAG: hypothetical protein CME15_08760, partial [Gemmatimonadetes bacterium]|nr:hypothetical protein [Gemmatimonadota bacterium]